jgi:hypothetical protein
VAKRQVPAGLRGTTSPQGYCGQRPPWIGKVKGVLPPRLLCMKRPGHKGKRHQNGQGHQWDMGGGHRKP